MEYIARFDEIREQVKQLLREHGGDYIAVREGISELKIGPNTVVLREDWKLAIMLYAASINPADLGADGKVVEVDERMDVNSASWAYWRNFHARRPDKSDAWGKDGRPRIELKTGAGDWFRSGTAHSITEMIEEYRQKKNTLIWWIVEKNEHTTEQKNGTRTFFDCSFRFEGTYSELFEILEQYNGSLATWVVSSVRPATFGDYYIGKLQVFSTSRRKCRFLEENLNTGKRH